MRGNLILNLSIKFLLSSKGPTLLLTLISFMGILLSTSALLLTTGLFHGFEVSLKEKILSTTPHVVVTSVGGNIEEAYKKAKRIPFIKEAIPFTLYTGAVSVENNLQVVSIKAVDFKNKDFLKRMERFMVDGKISEEGILIGDGLATTLGVLSGDRVLLISPLARKTVLGFIPKTAEFEVKGIFSFGSFEQDFGVVIMSKEDSAGLFGKSLSLEGIEIYTEDPYKVEDVKFTLFSMLGEGFIVRSWIDLHRTFFSALEMEKVGLFIVLMLMVTVSSFNIMSLLFIKMREKIKDIAILKTFGMTSRQILVVFLLKGMLICTSGLVSGTVTSFILSYFINEYKLIRVPAEIYLVDHIPVFIEGKFVIFTALGAVIISLLVSYLPARMASSGSVGRVLRNE